MSNWNTEVVGFIDFYLEELGDALIELVYDGAAAQEVIKILRGTDLSDLLMDDLLAAEKGR